MSKDTQGDAYDAETFSLDDWIDQIQRPEITVELYPHDADYRRRVRAIEKQIPAAEKVTDRGMDDPTPEQLLMQLDELKRERSERALRVRLRQVTDADATHAALAARKAKVTDPADLMMWGLSTATVRPDYAGPLDAKDVPPHFTGPQLCRLRDRDRSGADMVAQLIQAANGLMEGLPVPS